MKDSSVRMLVALLGMVIALAASAGGSSVLEGGGTVTMDPDTKQATVTRDGVTAPLWNGVHRMQDGSVMIVNDGGVVNNESSARPPHQLPAPESSDWEGARIVGYSPCEKLARQVCGQHDECTTAPACDPSRQLLAMEQEERTRAPDHSRMTYTSGQCVQAIKDVTFFSVCR